MFGSVLQRWLSTREIAVAYFFYFFFNLHVISNKWIWMSKLKQSKFSLLPILSGCQMYCVSFLPRDAIHNSGLCRRCHAVSGCPSVCPSRSWTLSKWVNLSAEFFSPSGSHTILSSISTPNVMAIFRRGPFNGSIECRWCRQKSWFSAIAASRAVNGSTAKCNTLRRTMASWWH